MKLRTNYRLIPNMPLEIQTMEDYAKTFGLLYKDYNKNSDTEDLIFGFRYYQI